MPKEMALAGTRVLEFTNLAPGQFATAMLADMGADVIKIERPEAVQEKVLTAATTDPRSLAGDAVNRNKRSLTLNMKSPGSAAIMRRLVDTADVLLEGFRPGTMERLGAGYDTLSKINPRLVYCSLSGFGGDGPYRDIPAHDIDFIALGGVLGLTGKKDGEPIIPLNIVADFAGASLHAVSGIMFALFARERSGKGQFVDVSYFDTTVALFGVVPTVQDYLRGGPRPARGRGIFGGEYANYTVYQTSDVKYITIGCYEPWLWKNLCDLLERPDLVDGAMKPEDRSKSPSPEQRAAREEMQKIFLTRTRDEWFELLSQSDICTGRVNDPDEVFDDPQVRHRGMAVQVECDGEQAIQPGIPIRLSETPGSVRTPAPRAGQHTEPILSSLGFSSGDIERLRRENAV
jgi:crotonobetainyl-CoA:carnitine CoA-transferase CaiB-like acyl-CoA transferase